VVRRSRLPILLLFALTVSACIGGNTAATADRPSVASTSGAVPTSTASLDASSAPPAVAPTATPEPAETPTAEVSPSASAADGVAAVEGCAGNDDNRTFWANAGKAMTWPVYCPALPDRWVVANGRYAGGTLEITYRGRGGPTLELREGAFCSDAYGCVPDGDDAGSTPFGDQTATLVRLGDGRFAAVVARGERLSWLAIGDGLDETTFRSFVGALIRLD
jgi:hypothetical protein